MINRLLLATGLAIARRRAVDAMSRLFYSFAAYAVLLLAALVAGGFLTAAGFVYLLEAVSVIEACAIMAGLFALVGMLGFAILRVYANRDGRTDTVPAIDGLQPALATTKADERLPVGIISLGLLLAAGYVAGRSLKSRRDRLK